MYDVCLHHVTLQDTFAILWNHLVMTQQCLQVTFCSSPHYQVTVMHMCRQFSFT